LDASVVGGNASGVDLIDESYPYPSDHKAVVVGLAWDMNMASGGKTESPSKDVPRSASMTMYHSILAVFACMVLHSSTLIA
jgi:hypothetical protein